MEIIGLCIEFEMRTLFSIRELKSIGNYYIEMIIFHKIGSRKSQYFAQNFCFYI